MLGKIPFQTFPSLDSDYPIETGIEICQAQCRTRQGGRRKHLLKPGVFNPLFLGQMQSIEPLHLPCGTPHWSENLTVGEQWQLIQPPLPLPNSQTPRSTWLVGTGPCSLHHHYPTPLDWVGAELCLLTSLVGPCHTTPLPP